MKTVILQCLVLLWLLGILLVMGCESETSSTCEKLCDQIGKCSGDWDNTPWSSNDDCVADCEDDPTPDAADNQCLNDCTDEYSSCSPWTQCVASCE